MKKLLLFLLILIIFTIGLFIHLNSPPIDIDKAKFQVNYGETVRTTARRLEKNQLIRNDNFFVLLSYLFRRKYIKAGQYEFYTGMTSLDILKKLTRGEVLTGQVTIPEGYNLYQIAHVLDDQNIIREGRFLYYAFDEDFLASAGINAPSAEGYLFPDTYVFPVDSDARDVIIHMYNKMKSVLEGATGNRGLTAVNIHKLLTLASLIEEEAKFPGERTVISSVFHNRLKKGMRMDCDPTIRYALKKFTGRLTYDDLDVDSPFNTYKHRGLPPTPISSPGRGAITAALKPARTEYLFFVARNDGSHYFSTTLREHNLAVEYYQKGINNGFQDRQQRFD